MQILSRFSRRFLVGLSFFVPVVVYLLTLAPSVSSQGDSGELISVAYLLGVAHPPGYPLFTLLGHLLTYLPLNSLAWRVNLLSALAHATALVFVFLSLERVTKNKTASVFTTLILAFSYTFWLYSLVTEVFALNDLFISILIYLGIVVYQNSKDWVKNLLLMVFVFALALTNHQSIVLLVPGFVYLLFHRYVRLFFGQTPRKMLFLAFKALFIFFLGLVPYLYLLVRGNFAPVPVAWSYPKTMQDLVEIILRSDYGTLVPYQGANPSLATLTQKLGQVTNYWRFLTDDFSVVGFGLFGVGLTIGFFRQKKMTMFFFISFLVGIFFLVYANFPFTEFTGTTLQIIERFYLLPNIFFAFLVGIGLTNTLFLFRGLPVLRFLGVPVTGLYLLLLFSRNYQLVSQQNNYLARQLGQNMLRDVPRNGLFVPLGDVPTFLTMHARYVENFRPDVEILTANQTIKNNEYKYLRGARPDLDLSMPAAASIEGVIRANRGKVRVAILGASRYLIPGMTASPSGFLYEFVDNDKLLTAEEWRVQVKNNLGGYQFPLDGSLKDNLTIGDRVAVGFYSDLYATLGSYCARFKLWSCAAEYYTDSLRYDSSVVPVKESLAISYWQSGECFQAEKLLSELLTDFPRSVSLNSDMIDVYRGCFKDESKAKKYETSKKQLERESQGQLKDL